MLYGNKSVDKKVSKEIRNNQIGHFVDNAQKRARCVINQVLFIVVSNVMYMCT